jgi:hypothetical protein
MRKRLVLLCCVLALVSCATPTPQIVRETVIVTQAPLPTYTLYPTYTPYPTYTVPPTPTKEPLTAQALSPLLIQSGDLPAGYAPSQVRDLVPTNRLVKGLPAHQSEIYQEIERNGKHGGEVFVLLFADADEAAIAFEAFLEDDIASANRLEVKAPTETDLYGERAYIWDVYSLFGAFVHASFQRCQAVAFVELGDTSNDDSVIAYARVLDQRLEPVVCGE